MARTETKIKANDGTEFKTLEEAESYDEICEAREELESATHKLNRLLMESFKTADGEPFKFAETHYYIDEFISDLVVRPLRVWSSDDIRVDENNCGFWTQDLRDENKVRFYRCKDMYSTEKAANQRLKELYRERITSYEAKIKSL